MLQKQIALLDLRIAKYVCKLRVQNRKYLILTLEKHGKEESQLYSTITVY